MATLYNYVARLKGSADLLEYLETNISVLVYNSGSELDTLEFDELEFYADVTDPEILSSDANYMGNVVLLVADEEVCRKYYHFCGRSFLTGCTLVDGVLSVYFKTNDYSDSVVFWDNFISLSDDLEDVEIEEDEDDEFYEEDEEGEDDDSWDESWDEDEEEY